ncbi:MAG TPA: hypothetical protein VL049_07055 [Candidatus Dormibacteraeota bacterium]|nr:hypothetical protein [Candidatus Dormibacteraeota bacterium]
MSKLPDLRRRLAELEAGRRERRSDRMTVVQIREVLDRVNATDDDTAAEAAAREWLASLGAFDDGDDRWP